MPRTNRITCAGCEKQINDNVVYGYSNSLFRLFLSARTLKKVAHSDAACGKCRSKFDNWIRKTKGDFDDILGGNGVENIMVSTFRDLHFLLML